MERMLTPEERIRRAEEIYNRRKIQNTGIRVTSSAVNNGTKPQYSLFKKMILQILICLLIYFIFYLIQNTNYIFSEDVISKTKEILSYDINVEKIYEEAMIYINDIKSSLEGKSENNEDNQKEGQENSEGEPNPLTEENIGGPQGEEIQDGPEQDIETEQEENKNLSQMEIDANDIKSRYSLIRPLEGTITSRYGIRNPTTTTVPKNHTGIDIAANTGKVIRASMDGVVELASSEGDYR